MKTIYALIFTIILSIGCFSQECNPTIKIIIGSNVTCEKQPQVYRAILNQGSQEAPTAELFGNNDFDIVWTRHPNQTGGSAIGTCVGKFKGKVFAPRNEVVIFNSSYSISVATLIRVINDDQIELLTVLPIQTPDNNAGDVVCWEFANYPFEIYVQE